MTSVSWYTHNTFYCHVPHAHRLIDYVYTGHVTCGNTFVPIACIPLCPAWYWELFDCCFFANLKACSFSGFDLQVAPMRMVSSLTASVALRFISFSICTGYSTKELCSPLLLLIDKPYTVDVRLQCVQLVATVYLKWLFLPCCCCCCCCRRCCCCCRCCFSAAAIAAAAVVSPLLLFLSYFCVYSCTQT